LNWGRDRLEKRQKEVFTSKTNPAEFPAALGRSSMVVFRLRKISLNVNFVERKKPAR
jgi:hypothetical protein